MKTLYSILLGFFLVLLGIYIGFTLAIYYYTQFQILGIGAIILGFLVWLGKPIDIMTLIANFRKDFGNKHDLKIVYDLENPDISGPELEEKKITGYELYKKNIRLDIQNNGDVSAQECEAHFKLKKPMDFKQFPSKEAKILRWVRDDSTSMNIKPHSKDNLLYLVILIDKAIDGNRGYVARPHNLDGPILHKKDGLKIGEYEFELTVYPSIGKPVSQLFRMNIGNEWKDFSLREIK